ncbi:alpha/beta hydrolase [Streptomyces sp. NPDC006923]|uniref:alpha/beta hydrolase n=1 Tax=Streptomyces sp. NPDC006923 TaxID=3155355 RepID=UPI0033FAF39D
MDPTVAVLSTVLNSTARVAPGLAGKGAFALFRRPLGRAKIRSVDGPVAQRAERGRLTVAGKSVTTYHWGDGPRPVLLAHGWGSRALRFGALVSALRDRGHSVIAFDAPGHGDSGGKSTTILEYRDIIRELQDRHGVFGAMVGYSFGSLSSFFAVREGVKTEALVGIAGVSRFDHLVSGFIGELGLRARLETELRARVEKELFPHEPDIWRRFAVPLAPEEIAVERILLVHDEDDRRARIHQAHETAEAYGTRAELFLTQGLGHHRVITAPEVVARVADFLDEPRGPSSAS